jgi:HD superfamily phosphodiesterase
MKQTAVEWLLDNLNSEPYSEADFKHNKECWDKAKEMEKEQMESAYLAGESKDKQYYNETFKNTEQ